MKIRELTTKEKEEMYIQKVVENEELRELIERQEAQLKELMLDKQTDSENDKLLAYLRSEKLSQVMTSVILKVLFTCGIYYFFARNFSLEYSLWYITFFFLAIYFSCSLFVIALKLTRNYILAFIVWFGLVFGIGYFMEELDALLGYDFSNSEVVTSFILSLPIFYDVFRIIRLLRK